MEVMKLQMEDLGELVKHQSVRLDGNGDTLMLDKFLQCHGIEEVLRTLSDVDKLSPDLCLPRSGRRRIGLTVCHHLEIDILIR